ncbi:arylsulfatase [Microlunatus endophyticus]
MSDEQSWNTMGCTGNPAARTPHLDELAGSGSCFNGFYTPFPLCCPSRSSLMTGLMPRHHDVLGNWRGIRPDLRTAGIGSWFSEAGYHSFYVGKWHVPGTDPTTMGFSDTAAIPAVIEGKDRGRYIEDYRDFASAAGYELLPGSLENLTAADQLALRDPRSPHRATAAISRADYLETWQTGQFAQVLDRTPDDQPWFGICSYNAPHFPLLPPAPFDTLIDRSQITLPPSWATGYESLPPQVKRSHFARDFADLDEDGWRDAIAHYLGLVALVDDQVGAIVDLLRSRGELDRTIIVFTSDHGDMMGAHRLMEKGHLLHYEEAVHIPLIIRHPDAGQSTCDGLVSMVDLAPTLLELAGVTVPGGLDGRSFADAVGGTTRTLREFVTAETLLWNHDSENAHGEHKDPSTFSLVEDEINLSIRNPTHRYIYRSQGHDELFDLIADPAETVNLASTQKMLVAGCRQTLADEVCDVFPEVADTLRAPAAL